MKEDLLLSQTLKTILELSEANKPISHLLNKAIELAVCYEQEIYCQRQIECETGLAGVLENTATETLRDAKTIKGNIIRPDFGNRRNK